MEVVLDNDFYEYCDECIKEGYQLFYKDIYISKKYYQKYLDKYRIEKIKFHILIISKNR